MRRGWTWNDWGGLGVEDAARSSRCSAAYVIEAQAHGDLDLPPLRQVLSKLVVELADSAALALGWRDNNGRLVGADRVRVTGDSSDIAEVGRLTVARDRRGQRDGRRLLSALGLRCPPA